MMMLPTVRSFIPSVDHCVNNEYCIQSGGGTPMHPACKIKHKNVLVTRLVVAI